MSPLFSAGIFAATSLGTVFVVIAYKISACSLYRLHAYVLPDEQQLQKSKVEGDRNPGKQSRKKKDKDDKFEDRSEIFRVTIGDSYLENARFYAEYDQAVLYSALGVSVILTGEFLGSSNGGGGFVPLLVISFCLVKLVQILFKVSWDKSSSRSSERALSLLIGLASFVLACLVVFWLPEWFLDFGLDSAAANSGLNKLPLLTLRLFVASAAAWLTGSLLGPAIKSVRCFWIGTNQLGWDISVVKTGAWVKLLLNLGVVLPLLTTFLWCKPMAQIFIRGSSSAGHIFDGKDWTSNFGFRKATFEEFKFATLLLTGLTQLLLLRTNVQSYLNLGVLAWYESLHGSKAGEDVKAVRNKIAVINYLICLVAVQNLVPGMMVILLAGLSRWDAGGTNLGFVQQLSLFFCWWSVFSWALLTCVVLIMFRLGLLLAY